MTRRGNNKFGAAGKGAVDARKVYAFFRYYRYEQALVAGQGTSRKHFINGVYVDSAAQRQLRRWQNGTTQHVSERGLHTALRKFGFDRAWFDKWVREHYLTFPPK